MYRLNWLDYTRQDQFGFLHQLYLSIIAGYRSNRADKKYLNIYRPAGFLTGYDYQQSNTWAPFQKILSLG